MQDFLPSQFPPFCLLTFSQSHPKGLQPDTAKYLCEQHFHQRFPADSDDSGKRLKRSINVKRKQTKNYSE